jgi:type II secretory pathway component GspD/PulD (secretin)
MKLLASLALALALLAQDAQVKVYPLGLADFDSAVSLLQALLSPDGKLVEERNNHRVIVYDTPAVHERIAASLRRISAEAKNVRISVSITATSAEQHEGVALPLPRPEIQARAGSSRTRVSAQQQVLVVSGGRASIGVAQRTPSDEWFLGWGVDQGVWTQAPAWREVGTSLLVQPTIVGQNLIRVRLTPELSYFVEAERRTTQVVQLATEVVVSPGQEIDVGGLPLRDEEFKRRFLIGYDESGSQQRVDVRLVATIE